MTFAEEQYLIDAAARIPGAKVTFSNPCHHLRPAHPSVHDMHMVKCSFLLNHEGPHSWGEYKDFPREWR